MAQPPPSPQQQQHQQQQQQQQQGDLPTPAQLHHMMHHSRIDILRTPTGCRYLMILLASGAGLIPVSRPERTDNERVMVRFHPRPVPLQQIAQTAPPSGKPPFTLDFAFDMPVLSSAPSVAHVTSSAITVSWPAPLHANFVTDYQIEFCVDKKPEKFETAKTVHGTTSAEIGDLQPGTSYAFRVTPKCCEVSCKPSPILRASTLAVAPSGLDAPSLAGRQSKTLTLKWNAPRVAGSLKAVHYKLFWDTGDAERATADFVEVYTGDERRVKLDSKLQPGTSYRFYLIASNDVGDSQPTAVVALETFPEKPEFVGVGGTVASLKISAPDRPPKPPQLLKSGINFLELAWTAPKSQGAAISSYLLELDDAAVSGLGFLAAYTGMALSTTIQNLLPRRSYRFRLSAENIQGRSSFSEVVTYQTLTDAPKAPPPPKAAGAASGTAIPLLLDAGEVNSEEPPDELEFELEVDDGQRWDATAGPTAAAAGRKGVVVITKATAAISAAAGSSSSTTPTFHALYRGKAQQFTAEQLKPGLQYSFRLACRNSGGLSPWSSATKIATLPEACSPPSAPQVVGAPLSHALALQWQVPAYDGGCTPSQYAVEVETAADHWSRVYLGPRPDCVVGSLQPCTAYKFRARAMNKAGWSDYSAVAQHSTAAAPPEPPAEVTMKQSGPSELTVAWLAPTVTHGSAIVDYLVELSRRGQGSSYEVVVVKTVKDLKAVFDSVQPVTEYSVMVVARNGAGKSAPSALVATKTRALEPGPMSTVSIAEVTSSGFRVSWIAATERGASVDAYNVDVVGVKTLTVLGQERTCTVEGLTPATTFQVRVQAHSAVGVNAYSKAVSVTTLKTAAAPPKLAVSQIQHNTAKISWQAEEDVIETIIEARPEAETEAAFVTVHQGTGRSCKAQKLAPATAYVVRGCCQNTVGRGDWSATVSFTTLPAPLPTLPPPRFTATAGAVEVAFGGEWPPTCVVELYLRATNEAAAEKAIVVDSADEGAQDVKLGAVQDFVRVYCGSSGSVTLDDVVEGMAFGGRTRVVRTADGAQGPWSGVTSHKVEAPQEMEQEAAAAVQEEQVQLQPESAPKGVAAMRERRAARRAKKDAAAAAAAAIATPLSAAARSTLKKRVGGGGGGGDATLSPYTLMFAVVVGLLIFLLVVGFSDVIRSRGV